MSALTIHNNYSYTDITRAYFLCRKHKRMTGSALSFELDFEHNLFTLLNQINNGTYEIGPTRVFVVTYPKPREVWAALFRDRIVHHLIYNDIAPFFERRFIEDTYACIKGRGALSAVLRCKHFLERITQYWSKPAWVLQLDIFNFFVSLNKDILFDLISQHYPENCLTLELIKYIIYNDTTRGALVVPDSDFSLIPKHKSLWHCNPVNGLPIGNLTSQLFANIYLNELDHFIKHTLRAKFYARYVDDFFILHQNRNLLLEYQERINEFLNKCLALKLNLTKTKIKPADSGINFLGTTIYPFRCLPRKMNVDKLKIVANWLQKNYTDASLIASVNSYLGLIRHTNAYKLRRKVCQLVAIPSLLGYSKNYTKIIRLGV